MKYLDQLILNVWSVQRLVFQFIWVWSFSSVQEMNLPLPMKGKKYVLKLQLCFHDSSKPDKAKRIWLGIFPFPVVAALLLCFHCCLLVYWLSSETLLCLLLIAIRRKNIFFRNRKEYGYHGILCIASCCGAITLPFPISSCTCCFPVHRAEGGTSSV